MKTLPALLAAIAFTCIAHGALDREAIKAELLKVEADFCALCIKEGAPAAFSAYIAPEGILLGVGPDVRGQQIVKDRYMDYAIGSALTWKPLVVEVSDSGELGYTTGTTELRTPGKDGAPGTVSHGRYFTIWKRQPDGSWKFVLDGGSGDHLRKKEHATVPATTSP